MQLQLPGCRESSPMKPSLDPSGFHPFCKGQKQKPSSATWARISCFAKSMKSDMGTPSIPSKLEYNLHLETLLLYKYIFKILLFYFARSNRSCFRYM